MVDTRTANMQRRRERILDAARSLLAEGGLAALNTRGLARAAGVSAPTLYNLIGSKDDILELLQVEAVELIEERLRAFESSTALDMAEAIVTESAALFGSDENYYKAAVRAADRTAESPGNIGASGIVSERSISMAGKACQLALDQGLLRGNVAPRTLGEHMFVCYRTPFEDWGYGLISLDEFARQALRGFYLTLAADAVDTFREQLLRKLGALDKPAKKRAAGAA